MTTRPSQLQASSPPAVRIHAFVSTSVVVVLALIWVLTTPGASFWPRWVAVPVVSILFLHAVLAAIWTPARRRALTPERLAFDVVAAVVASIALLLWGLWAIDTPWSFETPWPVWPSLGLGFVLALLSVPAQVRAAERSSSKRIEQLTDTRREVLEAQELELRRIERDLHDGAQARLVVLGMQLGQLEQQVQDQPELLDRVNQARTTATDAQRDLRDLARGIYPPVLADRGLVAAVESLASAAGGAVRVEANIEDEIPAAVEGACYFVVAESVSNAAKHAQATTIDVRIVRGSFDVSVTITDDGVGGADLTGSGIEGMRRRIAALDGSLVATSPAGGPTTIRAEIPCESS